MISTAQSDLLAYLRALNAADIHGCKIVEDVEFWASYGVHSVEDFEKYNLVSHIYETTKDAYGIKINWAEHMSFSLEELREIYNETCSVLESMSNMTAQEVAAAHEEYKWEDWMATASEYEDRF